MNPSTLLIILLSLVGLAVVTVTLILARRRAISRLTGAFDCSILVGDVSARRPRWRLGLAVLTVRSLDWYPVFGVGWRPVKQYPRTDMTIGERLTPSGDEQYALLPDAKVVVCQYGRYTNRPGEARLAMDDEALAAFSSWLESPPPGANHSVGRFT